MSKQLEAAERLIKDKQELINQLKGIRV